MAGKAPIGVELVRRGLIKESDVEVALSYQKEHPDKKLGDILNILNFNCKRKIIPDASKIPRTDIAAIAQGGKETTVVV